MCVCVYIYIYMYVHLCLCAGGLPYACVGDDLLLVVLQLSHVSSLHEKNSSEQFMVRALCGNPCFAMIHAYKWVNRSRSIQHEGVPSV